MNKKRASKQAKGKNESAVASDEKSKTLHPMGDPSLTTSEAGRCDVWQRLILDDLMPIKFRTNTLQRIHLHSYQHFIDVLIPQILNSRPAGYILDRGRQRNYIWIVKQYFSEPYFQTPSFDRDTIMTPQMAKQHGVTYCAQLWVRYRQVRETWDANIQQLINTEIFVDSNIPLANIPIMVHSPYCTLEYFRNKGVDKDEGWYDEGGYFIISGRTKQVIPQETLKNNRILVFSKTIHGQSSITAEVRSSSLKQHDLIIPTMVRFDKSNRLVVQLPQFRDVVPICVLLRALGMQSDREIMETICMGRDDQEISMAFEPSFLVFPRALDNDMDRCLYDVINTMEQAKLELLQYMRHQSSDNSVEGTSKRLMCLDSILDRDLLPHIDHDQHVRLNKAKYLCLMANRLLEVSLGRKPLDDRDSYANKRVVMVGQLLLTVFRKSFRKLLRESQRHYKKRAGNEARNLDGELNCPDISHNIKSNIIDKDMNQAIAKGEFPLTHSNVIKGVSMELASQTRLDTLSMQMRIKTIVPDKNIKHTANRLYHNTQAFMLCPVETPEGSNTGHHKHLTLTTDLTIPDEESAAYILNRLKQYRKKRHFGILFLEDCIASDFSANVRVFLNGNWLGIVRDHIQLVADLRRLRFDKTIHYGTSVVYDSQTNDLNISTQGGRFIRPLLTVRNNRLVISHKKMRQIVNTAKTWNDVIALAGDGMEYCDVDQLMQSLVAMTPAQLIWNERARKEGRGFRFCSHCELHPSLMLGKIGSCIPYIEYNQACRNMFQSSHGRQSVGQPNTNYQREHNTSLIYTLNYMQRPLVQTHAMPWLHTSDLPAGQNIVIAIMTYTGYNQEDAVILNKEALDAGQFRMAYYRKYESVLRKSFDTRKMDRFEKPHPEQVSNMRSSHFYDKLDRNGLVKPETFVKDGDVIIGKITAVPQTQGSKPYRDSSVQIKRNTSGYVDRVIETTTNNRDKKRIVRIRSVRTPQVGDKFSSRCGQKGTVGLILPRRDMPYTISGIVPDIIINPHCIPSRMTVGMLLELLIGPLAAEKGTVVNATAFTGIDLDEIYKDLEKRGYDGFGMTHMTNGMTGERLHAKVFVGTCYYQRLKHMVKDKIHTRSANGPTMNVTRQPAEGRANNGGFRIGEMERDSIIAHGASNLLRERLMEVSDEWHAYVCRQCGWFARMDRGGNRYICDKCGGADMISHVKMPYVFKTLLQLLKTINIDTKMKISNALLE